MGQFDDILDYEQETIDPRKHLATRGQRFVNYLVDSIVFTLFIIFFVIIGELKAPNFIGGEDGDFIYNVFYYLLMTTYYLALESANGKTIGKYITKTKVVDEFGQLPNFTNILSRTLSRFIPFEGFSYLFGSDTPIGWHDSISKTFVVKDEVYS